MNKFISALFLIASLCVQAQSPGPDRRDEAVRTVVQGYNQQRYRKMKQPWAFWGKLIVPKFLLKKEFKPVYARMGKARIDTIYRTKYSSVVKLKMEKTTERVFWRFNYNSRGKITGFGNAAPPMIYGPGRPTEFVNKPVDFKIDSVIRARYVTGKITDFNGCVLVMDNGVVVYKNAFGFADYNNHRRLNDSSMFELASCSKQFTAFAIMLLEKQGRLSYSDSIQKFIPGFPYHNIIIEQLLTHTSGLPDYELMLEKTWDKTKFATNADVIEQFKKYHPPVLFPPNERFEYSNTGYVILSSIIEAASQESYAQFLEDNIFKPLNMRHTRVYNTRRYKNEKLDNYAYGYVYSKKIKRYILPDSLKEYDEVIYQDAITGDGTVNSCTADLQKWEIALENYTLLDKQHQHKAFEKHLLNNGKAIGYGYGFVISEGDGLVKTVWHTGGWPGYSTIILRVLNGSKAVIVLSNNNYDNIMQITDDITALLLGE